MITFLLYFIIAILSTLIFLHKYKLKTWNEHGIPYDNPYFFATSLKGVGKTKHISEVYKSIYNAFKEKVSIVGFYKFSGPSLMLLDLEIIKQILIKDFSSFSHRGFYVNEKDDPLTANLIHVDGQRWKDLRQKLTSTFTSGKMKFMFPTFVEVSERFSNTLLEMIHEESTVKISELLGRFTMDIIGSCAFGIECNSLKDPEATFLRMGKGGLKNRNCFTVQVLMLLFPKLAAFFGMKIVPDQVSDFFLKIVQENVEYREKNNIQRNDFMNLLIEMKNKPNPELTMNELTAQAFMFFVAGFETSSTTLGFLLYEIALNQEIQEKLRAEINDKIEQHDGNFTYECMLEMKYMEQVILETLRKHSVLSFLIRKSVDDYIVPQTKSLIKKGTFIIIPVDAIHHDQDIYPDPEVFDPERFTPEAINSRPSCSYLAFGEGPRNCIGLRFGKMEIRAGLVSLLRKFKFSISEQTTVPIQRRKFGLLTSPSKGIFLKVESLR